MVTSKTSPDESKKGSRNLGELIGKFARSFDHKGPVSFMPTAILDGLSHQHLSYLKLQDCGIKSIGLEFNLPNLLVLDLTGNSLTRLTTGGSPNGWLDRMPRLQQLLVAYNELGRLDDLLELSSLPALMRLELIGNPISVDRNQLNRQLIENTMISANIGAALQSSDHSRMKIAKARSTVTNHEREAAKQRFEVKEAHRLREKLLAAETVARNLLRQLADSQRVVEAKQAEMEDIRCDLVSAKKLCQQLAKQMIAKNNALAEQLGVGEELEQKIRKLRNQQQHLKSDGSGETLSLLKRANIDELSLKNRELTALLGSKEEELIDCRRRLERMELSNYPAITVATCNIQQVDVAVETAASDELFQDLILKAMKAALEPETVGASRTEPGDNLQSTLNRAFRHFRDTISAREEDCQREWQTEREFLQAEIQTLRELMEAKEQRLQYYSCLSESRNHSITPQ